MSVKLQLTGSATFSSPRTYGTQLRLNHIILVEDEDAVILQAMTTKNGAGTTVPLFTVYAGAAATDFDLTSSSSPYNYGDGSVVVEPGQLPLLARAPVRGVMLRGRDGYPYGFSDGAGGFKGALRFGADLLGILKGANFNTTADQAIAIRRGITRFRPTKIVVVGASIPITTAAGGVYSGAAKSGTVIVAAAQAYSALSTSAKALNLTLATTDTALTTSQLYFALTTAQGAAATADIFLYGENLSS